MSNHQVAQTILEQIGGNMFSRMVGAKNFFAGDRDLTFRFAAKATNGANTVRVTLDASDTYKVEFIRVHGTSVREVSTHEFVYSDMLRGLFETETGLRVSMTRTYA